jgi:hypothetical protein
LPSIYKQLHELTKKIEQLTNTDSKSDDVE